MVVVACSETESTKGSVVVRKGLIAFKYLKLGNESKSDSFAITTHETPMIIIAIKNNKPFLL